MELSFNKTSLIIAVILVVLNLALGAYLFYDVKAGSSPELKEVKEKFNEESSFNEVATYFEKLAIEEGPPYAFEVLKKASLPQGLDMHLMAHVVGDVLYEKKGAAGMLDCTHDFRNACSHSIVVGIFTESGGPQAWPQIKEACSKAPGGSGAYTMCFHGVGHGVFSYTGYNLEKTVKFCEKMKDYAEPGYRDREWKECIGGAIMELVGGGFENRELYEKQSKKYLSLDNPLAPCNTDIIPLEGKPMCYSYITPQMFKAAGADLANPQPKHFDKSFDYCEEIPNSQPESVKACFGGVGKELIVILLGRDIRKVEDLNTDKLSRLYDLCLLADNERGQEYCVNSTLASLYWGGENDRRIAEEFCSSVKKGNLKDSCFEVLIWAVGKYKKGDEFSNYRKAFCNEIPQKHNKVCRSRLIN